MPAIILITPNQDIILVTLNKINTITILKYKYIKIIYKYKNNILVFRIRYAFKCKHVIYFYLFRDQIIICINQEMLALVDKIINNNHLTRERERNK